MLPEIATTACSKDNIKHGFTQVGIIDKEFNRYPVFNKILATCRQQPTLEEYCTVLESFKDFLEIMDKKGHIDEEQYNTHGIRMNKDINGKIFSEKQVLCKRVVNAQSVSPTFTKSICTLNLNAFK
jgi:hypothetical protein